MQLTRRRPRKDVWGLTRPMRFDLDDLFAPFFNDRWDTGPARWQPVVDIIEEENQFRVKAELPGMDKKDIQVDVEENLLTLKGERAEEKTDEGERYYRRERRFGSFTRTFQLPENVDTKSITAGYKDGVLSITIPKPAQSVPKAITIH